ncbi:hypothetical protein [Altererythrobacter sp. MF3-039]|uniref:hypothetical protein n=1 Tax=Altererythrobacter sp. MF3-039 TaxID=3252901 RepID=UPI00390C91C3
MNKTYLYAALAAGASVLVGTHSSLVGATLSAEQLKALDPTAVGRSVCRGIGIPGEALDQRLAIAQSYSASLGMGLASMPLYDEIMPTQLPTGGLTGEARRFFDQGMALSYGFNHAGGIRAFREAASRAPDCAMCWWAIAMANGPNINAPMGEAQNAAALAALAKAEALANAGSAEAELIAIQKLRFSPDPAADRGVLDKAYADAMLANAAANPDNDDIAVLAAESAMTTTAWYYWDDVSKEPQPRIGEAVSLIQRVVDRNPRHPQASHLYIHLMENGPDPLMAEKAADSLAASAPSALGHLVHMPSHIYYRIGRYADSMRSNIAGARADEKYLQTVGDDGLYRYGYYPHNVHFLLTSAQMVGNMHAVSQESARLKSILSVEAAQNMSWVQAIHAAPGFALAQFASPAAILALTDEPSPLAYVEAMRHYSRALAYTYAGDDDGFADEIASLDAQETAANVVVMREQGFPAPDIVRLASHVARGKYASSKGRHAEAVAHFEAAEEIEAMIPYNEPPYWYYPVAQSRGAALYLSGDYDAASTAFRKALFKAPNSGWALYGLMKSERKIGRKAEAAAAKAKLDEVWQGESSWLKMERL